ncbi:MAG: hypothetical protein A4E60_00178 [Syntrophorhabdus sp. PtaB.Bin047]|jgi:hypothetical protein|nr:MAG: hypothetical protein A4E60_00178 [Syntrophorhabdus sp. PtaB.Bin047]
MRTKTITIYKFDELPEDAQTRAVENLYDVNVDSDYWHEFAIDDAKQIAALMGIEIKNIYFSGFSSQGDGACFEGSYSYQKGSVKAVKEHAPQDEELHRIAQDLADLQRRHFYRLTAKVKHSGHYYHEYCTSIDVEDNGDGAPETVYDGIAEFLRDFMHWIYRQLEKEHDYMTSDEAIIETIRANEYEFYENGKLAA